MRFSFIHAADLHLDTPFVGLSHLPSGLREAVKDSTFQAFDHLIDLCIDKRVDFLLLAGDIYDSSDRSLRAQLHFQRGMERLAQRGIQVFVVHGNHDPLDGYRARLRWPENVHFFGGEEVQAVPFYKRGMEAARIYGISYPTARVEENLALRFRKDQDAPYAIGLLHANVGSLSSHDNYAPCTVSDLLKAHMDYWALGHIHARQILRPEEPVIVYPGNIQGRSLKEAGEKGCYLVEVNEQGRTSLSFHALDTIRWARLVVDATGCQHEQDYIDCLEDRVEQCVEEADGRSLIVQIEILAAEALSSSLRNASFIDDLLFRLRREGTPFLWTQSLSCRFPRIMEEDPFLQEMQLWITKLKQDPQLMKEILEEAWHPLIHDHRSGSKWLSGLADKTVDWPEELERLLLFEAKEE